MSNILEHYSTWFILYESILQLANKLFIKTAVFGYMTPCTDASEDIVVLRLLSLNIHSERLLETKNTISASHD